MRLEPVPNFEGYFSDEDGGVWSIRMKPKGMKLKMRTTRKGYGVYWLRKDGKTIACIAHRIVYSSFFGEIPVGYEVNHKDMNKQNNSIANLELLTRAENYRHAVMNGAIKRGATHPMSILTEDSVVEIRRLLGEGLSQQKIAKMFSVSQSQISQIHLRKSWSHIP